MTVRFTIGVIFSFSAVLAFASPALSAPEFLSYEGRNTVHDGQGGEKKTVDGIDFWSNGDPPHRYKVLGSLTDRRHKTGLVGMIRMSGLDADIAKAAKDAGGDAVILDEAHDETVGVGAFSNTTANGYGGGGMFHGSAFSSGFAAPIMKHQSRYIVVKYLPDESPAPVATPIPSSAQPTTQATPH